MLIRGRLAVWLAAFFICLTCSPLPGQKNVAGIAAVKQALDRLRVTGSVLMIAAHPDDENTAFLSYCSKGRKLRTGYLSLTRGEGGQNLIGSEQGVLLGVIRTQELLSARRIDGAEQFFTRAIDFGFSKTADETLAKWGRDEVLADVVSVIRRFQPDVIVLRFSGTARDGHGHHQASAMLGKEAFRAAADPSRFPEQLKETGVWQARRLLWNGFAFNRQQEQELAKQPGTILTDLGEYDPVLGYSYSEIAGMSRSQHRSQAMGAAERKGSAPNYFQHVDGQPAARDIMEEVDITWKRLPGGAAVAAALDEAQRALLVSDPSALIPLLAKARPAIAAIDHPTAKLKLAELDETMALAAGLWLDLSVKKPTASPGTEVDVELAAINRSQTPATLLGCVSSGPKFDDAPKSLAANQMVTKSVKWLIPRDAAYTQPFWLVRPPKGAMYSLAGPEQVGRPDNDPALSVRCKVAMGGTEIELVRGVLNRYVDRARGELVRPFAIVPPVTLSISETALVFPDAAPKIIPVEVRAHQSNVEGVVQLTAPAGWKISPAQAPFRVPEAGQQAMLSFEITPVSSSSAGRLSATATVNGQTISSGWASLNYEHIPPQTVLPVAASPLVRADIKVLSRQIGYIMGAGDEVPEALRQIGCDVTLIDNAFLSRGDLSRFDAIVTGVRAWNNNAELRSNYARLFDYVQQGGTLVVQYNVVEGFFGGGDPTLFKNLGPYPVRLGRERITVEESPVRLLKPEHRLLSFPNQIRAADFDGWVQERGLYFPIEWDAKYEAVLEMTDPGEKPLAGAILYAPVGKGAYVLTPLAFFRQLPAGVPGAYRLFANLVSAGKAQAATAP